MDNILSIIVMFFSGFIASIISAIVGFGGAILLLDISKNSFYFNFNRLLVPIVLNVPKVLI
jgi:hypothetical protein